MAFINYTSNSLTIKIVYYGPGLSGKTSNLRHIYDNIDPTARGEFICVETGVERTCFFDLLPIKAGYIGVFRVSFQLMSAPGQVYYEASRKNILIGTDGLVFVADSQAPLLDANIQSLDGLRRNFQELRIDLAKLPCVFQYNKRDLDNLVPVETLNSILNPGKLPFVEAAAGAGRGVFETLRKVARITVPLVRDKVFGMRSRQSAPPEDGGKKSDPDLI
jgi:signal recognition particle receptor subunit beta